MRTNYREGNHRKDDQGNVVHLADLPGGKGLKEEVPSNGAKDGGSKAKSTGKERVVPGQRLANAEVFYSMGLAKNLSSLIPADDVTSRKDVTEGLLACRVMDRILMIADILHVKPFVLPWDHKDSLPVPVVKDAKEYAADFELEYAGEIGTRSEYFDDREALVEFLHEDVMKLTKAKNAADESTEDKARRELKDAMLQWSSVASALAADKTSLENFKRDLALRAHKQWEADTDAVATLRTHLSALSATVQTMLSKVPAICEKARQVGQSGIDPLTAGDMRQVFTNLKEHYRREDSLGLISYIIDTMNLKQQKGETAYHYFARFDSKIQDMEAAGVKSISVKEFVGMCALNGFDEKTREQYLHMESTIMLSGLKEDGDEQLGEGDTGSVKSIMRRARDLHPKLQAFVRQMESMNNIGLGLGGGSKSSSPPPKTAEKKRGGGTDEALYAVSGPAGTCIFYSKYGVCNNQECKFKHTDPPEGKPAKCYAYDSGGCKFGAKCKYLHGSNPIASQGKGKKSSKSNDKEGSLLGCCVMEVDICRSFEDYEAEKGGDQHDPQEGGGVDDVAYATSTSRLPHKVTLMPDTAASISMVNHLGLLDDPKECDVYKYAHGIGGTVPITHEGTSKVFGGNKFMYAKGKKNPNLMSVGRWTQRNDLGQTGLALFGPEGGARVRLVHEDLRDLLRQLLRRAEELDAIEARSKVRNFVYEETYEVGSHQIWASDAGRTVESAVEQGCAVLLASGRLKMNDVGAAIHILSAAGVGKETLIHAVKNEKFLGGVPKGVTVEAIESFYQHVGKDEYQLQADITRQVIKVPEGYVDPDANPKPGQVFQFDAVKPSFGYADFKTQSAEKKSAPKKLVSAVKCGAIDACIAVDCATNYAHIGPRATKADPSAQLKYFTSLWYGKWGNLKSVRVDKEFVTAESILMVNEVGHGAIIRQSVPGDHRFATGRVEGCLRWIQDLAQSYMLRAEDQVTNKVITAHEHRGLWYLACKMACVAWNLKQSKANPERTRLQEFTGDPASLHDVVMLPFGMLIVAKKLRNDENGRGTLSLYLGPSVVAKGAIITMDLRTRATSVKFAFLPVVLTEKLTSEDYQRICHSMYGPMVHVGNLEVASEAEPESKVTDSDSGGGVQPSLSVPELPIVAGDPSQVLEISPEEEDEEEVIEYKEIPAMAPRVVELEEKEDVPKVKMKEPEKRILRVNPKKRVMYNVGVVDRGPKPMAPAGSARIKDPVAAQEWKEADLREAAKLHEEDTFTALPKDDNGQYVLPPGAIVLRMLRVREYKWKKDPTTGVERWLPCVRYVCNGSTDKRPDKFYAETPDRLLMLLKTSIDATEEEEVSTSDVQRAYLNALSIDRNIVVVAAPDMEGLPRMALLNKGLYGSRGGALSWQMWIDDRMKELGWMKCDVARGVYIKKTKSGEVVRAYRHSDDFRLSSKDIVGLRAEEDALRAKVRMAAFTACQRFLGCTFEHLKDKKVVLVRQVDKIKEMQVKFEHLHVKYNESNRERAYAVPAAAIAEDHELKDGLARLLNAAEIEEYQSLVGCIGWISGSTRPDVRFGYFLVASRLVTPREWDMYLAVHIMDYLVATVETPLVLGGPVFQPEVYADASFAILPERVSPVGHVCITCPGSGAIYTNVSKTRCAVTSVFEAELIAGCQGVDTALYVTEACKELLYPVSGRPPVIKVDNKAELDWVNSSISNKRSRHMEVRFYRVRHLQASGEIEMEHVPSRENIADILTKPMVGSEFRRAAALILGHRLVQGLGIPGVFELDE